MKCFRMKNFVLQTTQILRSEELEEANSPKNTEICLMCTAYAYVQTTSRQH